MRSREKNREAARISRARKAAEREKMQRTIEQQAEELVSYKSKVDTLEAEVDMLGYEKACLQVKVNKYETITYNPTTGCYSRGLKIRTPPTLFFKQVAQLESDRTEESTKLDDEPLPRLDDDLLSLLGADDHMDLPLLGDDDPVYNYLKLQY